MATITNTFPVYTFPSELDHIQFSKADGPDGFEMQLRVDAVPILVANMAFGGQPTVSLSDLSRLISTHVREVPCTVDVQIDGMTEATTVCIPCQNKVDMPATEFVDSHFLNRLKGDKVTYPNADEYLSLFVAGPFTVSLSADFLDGNDVVETVEKVLLEDNLFEQIAQVHFRVKDLIALRPTKTLLSFTVSSGVRKQRFNLLPWSPAAKMVVFANSFGQSETLLFDMVDTKVQPETKTAKIDGKDVNYLSRAKKTYNGVINFLPDAMLGAVEDFFVTPYFTVDGEVMRIMSGEVVSSTDVLSAAGIKASWQESLALSSFRPLRRVNTFDITFDKTFE